MNSPWLTLPSSKSSALLSSRSHRRIRLPSSKRLPSTFPISENRHHILHLALEQVKVLVRQGELTKRYRSQSNYEGQFPVDRSSIVSPHVQKQPVLRKTDTTATRCAVDRVTTTNSSTVKRAVVSDHTIFSRLICTLTFSGSLSY